jgi:rRNA maturation endonuclease Nob1
LIDDVSRQFKANYDKQIQILNEKLKVAEELNERAKNDISSNYQKEIELQKKQIESLNTHYANQMEQLAKLNEERAFLAKTQIEQLKMELAKAQSSSAINWAFVIAAIILGVLIGTPCNKPIVISL